MEPKRGKTLEIARHPTEEVYIPSWKFHEPESRYMRFRRWLHDHCCC